MTQGLVTVKSKGKVVMKIVAGCDGYNARKLANRLRKAWPVSAKKAYQIAKEIPFGSPRSLVVVTKTRILYKKIDDDDEGVSPLYRKTFDRPRFNPRWEEGTADHIAVINV